MDWFLLFWHALWTGGLAVMLATLSVAYWRAASKAAGWRDVFHQTGYQSGLNVGFIGFSSGLALSVTHPGSRVFC